MKNVHLFYGGEFRKATSGAVAPVSNPATGQVIAQVSSADADDVDAAVETAAAAWPTWWDQSVARRATTLSNVASAIRNNAESLAQTETINTGRVIAETRLDIDATADLFDYFAGVLRSEEDSVKRHDPTAMSLILREPYGVVGAIVPWNYPFLIAGWKIAPALAAGNAIILKPASLTPLSVLELADITHDVIPAGLFNVLPGGGSTCGEAILQHPGVRKLSFTGSAPVGRHVAEAAARRGVPVTLELGGKSANIVFPDTDMDRAVETAAMAIMMSQGQVCSAGSRLLLHDSIYESFLNRLVKVVSAINIGNPLAEDSRMGPMASKEQFETVMEYIELGKGEGAAVVCGGTRLTGDEYDSGYYLQPTVFSDCTDDMRIVQEEIFGPVLTVQRFTDADEAIRHANATEYGLAGAVWSRDINTAMRVAQGVRTGTMWINDYHPVPSGSPFGGFGSSGYGREVHKSALESYSQYKTIYISTDSSPYGWY